MILRSILTNRRRIAIAALLLALVPQLVLPVGSVLCIEPCGQVRLAASHVAQGCEHEADDAGDRPDAARSECGGGCCRSESAPERLARSASEVAYEISAVPPTCCDVALDLDPVTEATRRLDRATGELPIERPHLENHFARVIAALETETLALEPPPELAIPRPPGSGALPRPLRI